MLFSRIIIAVFMALESANVVTLYFFPESRYANGVGVFRAWRLAQDDPAQARLSRYLVNWVAGAKLIFLGLLGIILWCGDAQTLRLTSAVMALTIATFFWRLYPLARQMAQAGELTPPNYHRTLAVMIAAMIAAFLLAAIV